MHQSKVLVFGPMSFISTLIELKGYLKFNFQEYNDNINHQSLKNFDIFLFHEEILVKKNLINIIENSNAVKIFASKNKTQEFKIIFNDFLLLPSSLNEINSIVDINSSKRIFKKNSTIQIKEYFLDKNQKKLKKKEKSIILTEKEIQLLELFLIEKKPVTKNKILSTVWNYSSEADTHTVETHIYRLRKKIYDKFLDEKFILNEKDGYHL
jgi:hypothetical protein|tara:strand:- start:1 stop:630 length:630 start_codon:yes stop_codon:yes gene_type:complete